jgi:hypothetical protein
MLVSASPNKFNFAWGYGQSAPYIRAVPLTTSTPGAASIQLGYPAVTFTPTGAGGIPPDGADENGILNQITLWLQWFNGGGPIFYDSVWAGATGGYPKWSMLSNAATPGLFWISTADGNVSNPDTGGAGWVAFPSFQTAATASDIWLGTDITKPLTSGALAGASAQQTVADAATIAWNMVFSQDAYTLLTQAVGSSRSVGTPTGIVPGRPFSWAIQQPLSGPSCAIPTNGWSSIWDFMAVGPPTLSTGNGTRDLITGKHDQASGKLISVFTQG